MITLQDTQATIRPIKIQQTKSVMPDGRNKPTDVAEVLIPLEIAIEPGDNADAIEAIFPHATRFMADSEGEEAPGIVLTSKRDPGPFTLQISHRTGGVVFETAAAQMANSASLSILAGGKATARLTVRVFAEPKSLGTLATAAGRGVVVSATPAQMSLDDLWRPQEDAPEVGAKGIDDLRAMLKQRKWSGSAKDFAESVVEQGIVQMDLEVFMSAVEDTAILRATDDGRKSAGWSGKLQVRDIDVKETVDLVAGKEAA